MRLHGFVWLIIGIVVAAVSFVMMQRGQKMTLFLYVGIAMAVFGLWRLYIDKGESKETTEERRAKLAQQLPQGQTPLTQIPRVCGMCGTKNSPRANYCGFCGNKL